MIRNKALLRGLLACAVMLVSFSSWAGALGEFSPLVGNWRVDTAEGANVVVVDGSILPREHFPIAEYSGIKDFREGTITVQFKPVAGKSDQAGGIFFDRKGNGDYMVVRANALENNLNLYRYAEGRRTSVKEVGNAPAATGVWHEVKLVVSGSRIQGYLDGKLVLTHDLGREISGGVGIWSKDDSVALFKDFQVAPGKH